MRGRRRRRWHSRSPVAARRVRRSLAGAKAAYAAAKGDFDAGALAAEDAERDVVRTETLHEAVGEADQRRDELLEARSAARLALQSALAGDGGVAPDQERAALVEALRQAGREALVRQLGPLAARSALRRFPASLSRRDDRGDRARVCPDHRRALAASRHPATRRDRTAGRHARRRAGGGHPPRSPP